MAPRFFVETLGCPKNAVDSDKVVASLLADGLAPVGRAEDADLIVVNTCAFVEAARQESIDTALALADVRRPGARFVVTGCMAERYGTELAEALPEADSVVGFAGEGSLSQVVLMGRKPSGVRDLLELPRPAPTTPWAYVKVAEGCDRACAFCAIPSFRGKQRSRSVDSIEAEVRALVDGGVAEIVLVAQDLAWYGRDVGAPGSLAPLLRRLDQLAPRGLARVRLLYLYPSEVKDPLLATMLELETVVPYFDLSLQHASAPLLRSMKRWGSGDRFVDLIARIPRASPTPRSVRRSSSASRGRPKRTTTSCSASSARCASTGPASSPSRAEDGTPAATRDEQVPEALAAERLRECSELQDPITQASRDGLVGRTIDVLVDGVDSETAALIGRTHREAPEIDGLVHVTGDAFARPGALVSALVTDAEGPDLVAHATAAVATREAS